MSRSLLRSALELRNPITRLPPTFLLPIRARCRSISSTYSPQQRPLEPSSPALAPSTTVPPPGLAPSLEASPPQQTSSSIHSQAASIAMAASETSTAPTTAASEKRRPHANSRRAPTTPPPPPTGPIPESVKTYLPLLRSQPGHYITIHINGRPYLVTEGDSVRLPFLMPDVGPGDVLRLNRASVLGSRDLTLRPSDPIARTTGSHELSYIDERLYECRATIIGVDSEPLRFKEKTKRRNRKVKTVKSKHRYTVLRISELKIKSPAELEA